MVDTVPDVTVVIPAYHAEAFVARAIQSVLDQPGVNPEIIVVVDGLVDRTADNARGFPKTRVVINEENRGASASRNRGLALAQAPYVMFLDADDWVEGPLLQGLAEALDVFQADIAFGPCKKQRQSGEPSETISWCAGSNEKPFEARNWDLIITGLMTGIFIVPCSTMWSTNYIREVDGWDESLLHSEDFELVYRSLTRGAKVTLERKGCGVYYQHNSSHRLTLKRSKTRWQSQLTARVLIAEHAKTYSIFDANINKALINEAESQMRLFARDADRESYQEAKKFFKKLGGTRLSGTLAHRLGSLLLGLRQKEQLALKLWLIKKMLVRYKFL